MLDPEHGLGEMQGPKFSRRWTPFTKQMVLITILVGAVYVLFRFSGVLVPTVIACLLAYILAPMVGWLQKRAHIPRGIGILLGYFLLFGLLASLPILIIPSVVEQIRDLNLDLQTIIITVVDWIEQQQTMVVEWLGSLLGQTDLEPLDLTFDVRALYNQLGAIVEGVFSPAASGAFELVVNVTTIVLWALYILMVTFYLLASAPLQARYYPTLLPPQYRDELLRLLDQIDRIWRAFFRGQLILSVTMGIVVAVMAGVLGLRNALALGLLAGVLEFIPSLGPVLAATPAVLLALFQGSSYIPLSNWSFAVVVAGSYLVVQQIENNYLVPRIIGRSVNLHPLVVFIGVVLGGSVAGILGIFLAAPTLATLRILLNYTYRKLLDLEPFGEGLAPLQEETVPRQIPLGTELIEAVFFDLDGTLIETDDALAGQDPGDDRGLKWGLAVGAWRTADRAHQFLDRVGFDDEADRFRDWLGERVPTLPDVTEIPMVDGARDALQELARRYRLALVTTRPKVEVYRWLDHHGLADTFDSVTTNDDVDHRKPHPEGIFHTAENLRVPVNHCVMVGDTVDDLESARQAGALAIAVMTGMDDEDALSMADMTVNSVADLPRILT